MPSPTHFIIGGIAIDIAAFDEQSAIQKPLFSNGKYLKYRGISPPNQGQLNEKTWGGIKTIRAKACDTSENSAENDINILIYSLYSCLSRYIQNSARGKYLFRIIKKKNRYYPICLFKQF